MEEGIGFDDVASDDVDARRGSAFFSVVGEGIGGEGIGEVVGESRSSSRRNIADDMVCRS